MLLYNKYFAIQYLKSILLIFFIALALIFLIDISEISRRLADVSDVSLMPQGYRSGKLSLLRQ